MRDFAEAVVLAAERLSPDVAARSLMKATEIAVSEINKFSSVVLKTRGGRMGAGMGTLLEALWGYYVNQALVKMHGENGSIEIGWLSDNEYNDFACIYTDEEWTSSTKAGEVLRIEAKSMNKGTEESKAHFEEIAEHLGELDLLLVLIWSWVPSGVNKVSPYISDYFIDFAYPVSQLRDALHLARGGSFVDRNDCPDRCIPSECTHHGEPLNAQGKRERLTGPSTRQPAGSSYANNFGGLVRMLKTSSPEAKEVFRRIRRENEIAGRFIDFIHRNYPSEEANQYRISEWRQLAEGAGITTSGVPAEVLLETIRTTVPGYRDKLRQL